jgi:hypothetical protein
LARRAVGQYAPFRAPRAPFQLFAPLAVRAVSRTARAVSAFLRRLASSRRFAKPPFNQFRRQRMFVTEPSMTEIMKPNSE